MITIYNTLTGKKELFKPIKDPIVTLYVCGITPYDYAHLGHGRVYVIFDVLYRLLSFNGYKVQYCRNFTDIDDKIIARAEKELGSADRYAQIANKYIQSFEEDMSALFNQKPGVEPRVTQTIPEIIKFIEGLIEHKKAYVSDGDVYFDIMKFPTYGQLSKQKIDDLIAGARVEVNEKKRHPLDFALWKSEPETTFWKSPWGWGRPGWHIECSAMAAKYLGTTIDIHAGGQDLMFPHHENERAQSEGLYEKPFVHYWMHNGFVRINKEKMSKSLGNFFTLRDIFKKYDPVIVRYYLLNHHYRAPLDFSFDDLDALTKSYQRLARAFDAVDCKEMSPLQIRESKIVQKMLDFLSDDLNTPGMFGVLFENLSAIQGDREELCRVKEFMRHGLGLPLVPLPEKEVELTPEIARLINEREAARLAKDFKKADEIRDKLKQLGYEAKDKKIR